MEPWVARFGVFVSLSNGVHSGGASHTAVQLDAVHDMAALFPRDYEPSKMFRLRLVQSLAHRRG